MRATWALPGQSCWRMEPAQGDAELREGRETRLLRAIICPPKSRGASGQTTPRASKAHEPVNSLLAEACESWASITCSDKSLEQSRWSDPTLPASPHPEGPLLEAELAFSGTLREGGYCP